MVLLNKKTQLSLHDFQLNVYLGWPKEERLRKQKVLITLEICFKKTPKACVTDKLEHTVCYHHLTKAMVRETKQKHFFLIEHLAAFVYGLIKSLLPKDATLSITLAKKPKIKNLLGGAHFRFGDF